MENSKSSKPTEADYVRQGAIDGFRGVIDTTPKIKRSWDPLKIKKHELPDYIKYDPVLWQFFRRLHYQNKNFICLIVGEPGCQPKGSKVLMANGEFKNIENIKVGDRVVSPQKNGKNIFSTVTNLIKHKQKQIFNVKEINKTHQILYSCSDDHIIPLNYAQKIRPRVDGKRIFSHQKWVIKEKTAKDFSIIAENQKIHKYGGFSSFKINKFENQKNASINPYFLGVWLGDGNFNQKSSPIISCSKQLIIQKINSIYKISSLYTGSNGAKRMNFKKNSTPGRELLKYNLIGKTSGTKFIPKECLLSSIDYRKKLLAGLIDTDGYYKKGSGGYNITTKSKCMGNDILFLVKTLGGRGTIRKVTKKIKSYGFVGEYYSVSFYLHDMKLPLQVDYKKKDVSSIYKNSNRVAITVKKNGKKDVFGFSIDSPSEWYITDNFMITHNSGKSLTALQLARLLDITPLGNGKFKENFILKQGKDGRADAESKLVFGPSDFLRLVKSGLQRGSCIVWDEAGVGNDATKWNDRKSQLIKHIMQTFRSRNYGVFMTVPDKESVTLSTRRLVHCYIDVFKRTPTHAEMNIVWLKRERTGEKTTTYYKRPTFVDPVSGQLKKIFVYRVPKISWSIENTYNKIKDSTLQNLYEFYQREMEIMEKELGMDQEQGLSAGKKLKKFNMSSAVEICNEVAEDLLGEDFRPSEAKIILRMSNKGYDCSKQQAKLVAELVNQKGNTGMN